MALPQLKAAQWGAMLAPTLISAGSNLLLRSKPSQHEQRLSRFAKMFEDEATAPITENREFRSGMKVVDQYDKQNRRAINNQSAASGSTDEAKIASMGSANQSRDMNIDRLLNNARRYRNVMQNRALSTSHMLEQARQMRAQQWQQGLQSIVQPLGRASNAFLMSSMFDTPGKTPPPGTGAVNPIIDTAGGFRRANQSNALNQALSQGMWG